MLGTAELLSSIETIYDAVLDPSRWVDALDCTASAAGAYGAMLMVRDPYLDALQIHVMSRRINVSETRTYVDTLLSRDELRWDEALEGAPALHVLHDQEIWTDRAAFDAMPSQQWLRSWGIDRRSAARLSTHRAWKDTVALLYPVGRPGMTAEEERSLGPLLPHLARASEIRRPFALLESRYRAILTMLDHLGIGVLLVLEDDHVLLANAEAERILDAGDALRRRSDGRLWIPRGDAKGDLARTLAELRDGHHDDGATVYLPRGVAREPYVVDVIGVTEGGAELGTPIRGALLCVIDPEHRGVISTRGLAQVYDLTDAEAAVCRLMSEGRSNREIAEIRGVSLETVKAQSKAILRKASCSNRVELVRRALSIAPPILDAHGRREDDAEDAG